MLKLGKFWDLGFQNVKRGFCYFDSKICVLGFKIRLLLLVVDIWAIGAIMGNGVENPNLLYKLIDIINLGKLWTYGIKLEIMKLPHYVVKWWSRIYKPLTFENIDILSVGAFIICLEIIAWATGGG